MRSGRSTRDEGHVHRHHTPSASCGRARPPSDAASRSGDDGRTHADRPAATKPPAPLQIPSRGHPPSAGVRRTRDPQRREGPRETRPWIPTPNGGSATRRWWGHESRSDLAGGTPMSACAASQRDVIAGAYEPKTTDPSPVRTGSNRDVSQRGSGTQPASTQATHSLLAARIPTFRAAPGNAPDASTMRTPGSDRAISVVPSFEPASTTIVSAGKASPPATARSRRWMVVASFLAGTTTVTGTVAVPMAPKRVILASPVAPRD